MTSQAWRNSHISLKIPILQGRKYENGSCLIFLSLLVFSKHLNSILFCNFSCVFSTLNMASTRAKDLQSNWVNLLPEIHAVVSYSPCTVKNGANLNFRIRDKCIGTTYLLVANTFLVTKQYLCCSMSLRSERQNLS